jgi:hypothetical protein|tara:strand:+ start:433 stop:555 length:123 start_codon:yes stop_codon:yes gene_type:complete
VVEDNNGAGAMEFVATNQDGHHMDRNIFEKHSRATVFLFF